MLIMSAQWGGNWLPIGQLLLEGQGEGALQGGMYWLLGKGVREVVLVCVSNFLSYKALPIAAASHIPSGIAVSMSGLPFL